MKMNKKGAVTVYIIIGIIIVIAASLLFVYRGALSQRITESMNPEVKPLRLYIEDCAEQSVQKAIELAALQGGYIELPEQLEYAPLSRPGYLPPPPAGIKIPMWWYDGKSFVPTNAQMKEQFDTFVQEEMEQCISDFNAFPQLRIEEKGPMEVTVNIWKRSIVATINYPLIIKIGEKDVELDKFTKAVPSSFSKLYEFANDIMEYENENFFLEDLTMDMIAVADGVGESPHMPLDGFDIRCGKGKEWSEQLDLIPALQELVKYNFRFLRFDNAKSDIQYEPNPEIEQEICVAEDPMTGLCTERDKIGGRFLDYYDSFYTFDTSSDNYPDVKVIVQYDKTFGMSMDVDPSDGDKVSGFDMDFPILGNCIKVYHHRYDIEYPLIFTLQSDDGLQFNFATPVMIEKNAPKRVVSPFVLGEYTYSPSSEDYCDSREYPMKVFVKDEITGEYLDSASVRYECVRFSCDMGETTVPSFDGVPIAGSVPVLDTLFPACINGFFVVKKDGYLDSVSQLTVSAGAQPPAVSLTPLKKLKPSIFVVELQGTNVLIRDLKDNEKVYVSVYNSEKNYEDNVLFPTEAETMKDLELIYDDLIYNVDAKLLVDDKPVGGYYFENWKATRNMLSSSNEFRLYVIASSTPIEDLEEFSDFWAETVVPKSKEFNPILR